MAMMIRRMAATTRAMTAAATEPGTGARPAAGVAATAMTGAGAARSAWELWCRAQHEEPCCFSHSCRSGGVIARKCFVVQCVSGDFETFTGSRHETTCQCRRPRKRPAGLPSVTSSDESDDTDTDADLEEELLNGHAAAGSAACPPGVSNGRANGVTAAQRQAAAQQHQSRRTPVLQQACELGNGWQQAANGDSNFHRNTPSQQQRPSAPAPAAPNGVYVPPHAAAASPRLSPGRSQQRSTSGSAVVGKGGFSAGSSGGFNQAQLAALSSAHAAAELTLRASGISTRPGLTNARHVPPAPAVQRPDATTRSPFMHAPQQDERSRPQPSAGQPPAQQVSGLVPVQADCLRPAQYHRSDVIMDDEAGVGARLAVPQAGPLPPVPAWQQAALPPLPGRSPPWTGVAGPQPVPRASPPLSPGQPVAVVGPPPLTLPPTMHFSRGTIPAQPSAMSGQGHDQLRGALANGHMAPPAEHGMALPTSTDSSIASVMAGTPMTSDSGSHLSSSDSPRWASASSAELMSSDSPRSSSQQAGSSVPSSVAAPRSHGRGPAAGDDPHDFGADAGSLQRFQQGRVPAGRQAPQQHQQQGGEGSRRHSADLPPMNQQRGARREVDARTRLDLRSHRSVEGDQVRCLHLSPTLSRPSA